MWFTFGFLTLIISTLYFGVQRYKGAWKGIPISFDGQIFSHLTTTNNKKTASILIGCESVRDIDLSIKMETWWDRLFKWLGLINEYQIGKDYLDRKLFVMSDNPAVCEIIGRSTRIQQALSEIIILCHKHEMKLKGLHLRNKRIWVNLVPINKTEHMTSVSLAYLFIPTLKNISETYNSELTSSIRSFRDPTLFKTSVILAISAGMAITGVVHIFLSFLTTLPLIVDVMDLFKYSLAMGTVVIAILASFAIYYLKKTSRLHLVLIELLTVGYFGAVSCSYVLVGYLNIELDISPSQEIVASVQSTYISKSRKRGKRYYFYINDWGKPGTLKIKVYPEVFNQYRNGDKVRVVQSNGFFGFRWVSSIEVDKRSTE